MKMMIASHKRLKTMVFETRIEPCRWKVLADVRPFCRKGLRSPAATCDQTSFDSKIMSPEITAPHFVVPCDCSCLFYESDVCKVMYVVNETIEKNTHMKAQMQDINSLQHSIGSLRLRADPAGVPSARRQNISSPHLHPIVMT